MGPRTDSRIPPALRYARENAAARRKTADATARGYYKRPGRLASGAKRRYGDVALREIVFYQKTYSLLMSQLPFARTVREILRDTDNGFDKRMTAGALYCLQEGAEAYLINLFCDSQLAAIHGKRITVMPKDVQLVRRLRNEKN